MNERLDWAGMAKALNIPLDSPAIANAQADLLYKAARRDILMKMRGR